MYLKRLNELREGNTAPEYVDREILLEFLRVNEPLFSDFPKREMQQVAVVDLICLRSFKFNKYKYFQNILQGFLTGLGTFSKTNKEEDPRQYDRIVKYLLDSEELLVKCLQAVIRVKVNVLGLVRDVMANLYTEEGAKAYDQMVEDQEFSQNLWRAIIEDFIKQKTLWAYDNIIDKSKYRYSRSKKYISITFSYDHLLEELRNETTAARLRKKHMFYFETDVQEFEYKRSRQAVHDFLLENMEYYLDSDVPESAVESIVQIIGYDESVNEYKKIKLSRVMGTKKESWSEAEKAFRSKSRQEQLQEQILAAALGASMAFDTIHKDFMLAVNVFSTKNLGIYEVHDIERISRTIRFFILDGINQTMRFMLEKFFFILIKNKSMDKKEKVEVKMRHKRRVELQAMEELGKDGVTKIQRKKLFVQDPSHPGMCEFIAQNRQQLEKAYKLLQISPYMQAKINYYYENPLWKIEFIVAINLDLLAKQTMNLKKGLSEILYKYGIIT